MGLLGRLRREVISEAPVEKPYSFHSLKRSSFIKPRVWAIGGGKGGIGKSLIASSLGILLSKKGRKTLLVDADLGAANLHTFIKAEPSKMSLSSFLMHGDNSNLPDLIGKTAIPNLDLISGARDSLDVANFDGGRLKRLQNVLDSADYDYILLDVGPGTSSGNLDLFSMADEGIIITTAEPTSIENTYRFLKCLYARRLKNIMTSQDHKPLKEALLKVLRNAVSDISMAGILENLAKLDHVHAENLKLMMGDGQMSIIVNQTKRPGDRGIGASMQMACRNYFGLNVEYLGCVCYENYVSESISIRKPLVVHYKKSGVVQAIDSCLLRLVGKANLRRLSLSREGY